MNETIEIIELVTRRALAPNSKARGKQGPTLAETSVHLASLRDNACIAELPEPPGRLPFAKKALLSLARFILVRQQAVNVAMTGALDELFADLAQLRSANDLNRSGRRVKGQIEAISARLAIIEAQLRLLPTLDDRVSGAASEPISDGSGSEPHE